MTHAPDSRLRDRIRLILCGAAAVFAASYGAGSIAETTAKDTAADALEEITVTAQRREENARRADQPDGIQRGRHRTAEFSGRRELLLADPERQFHVRGYARPQATLA